MLEILHRKTRSYAITSVVAHYSDTEVLRSVVEELDQQGFGKYRMDSALRPIYAGLMYQCGYCVPLLRMREFIIEARVIIGRIRVAARDQSPQAVEKRAKKAKEAVIYYYKIKAAKTAKAAKAAQNKES